MANKHTLQELQQWQSLPLSIKVAMTKDRIRNWVHEYGEDGVYVSFSGGKDSTVLLHIVREAMGYKNIPAVFVDTGLEYPEIRDFVKTFDNVEILRPKLTFKRVIEKYGYPFFSKEVSNNVDGARKYLTEVEKRKNALTDRQTGFHIPTTTAEYVELANMINNDWGKIKGSPQRLAIILGMRERYGKATIPNGRSRYSMVKYQFLLDSPFKVSDKCCNIMKKNPVHEYARKNKRKPMTAQMASESQLRTQKWIQNGCNGFDMKEPISNPMAFWTEQDVLLYIKMNHLPICSVYGDIVEDRTGTDEVEGQLTISDIEGWEKMGMFDADKLPLKTTGCNRTGCMFCGYGCHLEKPGEGRFERMKETHPKQYEYIMKTWKEGGLNYKNVIDWINEHGNMNIRY